MRLGCMSSFRAIHSVRYAGTATHKGTTSTTHKFAGSGARFHKLSSPATLQSTTIVTKWMSLLTSSRNQPRSRAM